jgi:hypothetical protein
MYIVGFVDNSFDLFHDYKVRLKRHDVELLSPSEKKTKEEIMLWILDNNIHCLMVDHKLRPDYDFAGTDLVAYINSVLPDLPCMILTAYPQESLNENLVIKNMIEDRDSLGASNISTFADELKQAVEVFCNRLERHEEEYQTLLQKKKGNSITAHEEERLDYLYKLLRAYGKIDEIPTKMLKPDMEDKMDKLIGKLNDLLSDISSEKGYK